MHTPFARMLGLLGLLLGTSPLQAAGVQRCVGAQGEPMFAPSCAGAREALPSPAAARSQPTALPVVAATAGCARTPAALQAQLQAALHAGNGVRLSGLVLWRGYAARGELRGLLQLLKAGSSAVSLQSAAQTGDHAVVVTSLSEQSGATRSAERWFGLAHDHGCYWLDLHDGAASRAAVAAAAWGDLPPQQPWP